MKKNYFLRFILLSFAFFIFVSCGSNKKNKNSNTNAAPRTGQNLSNIKIEHIDYRANFDSNGSNIVFISGRNSKLRSYKRSASNNSTPSLAFPNLSNEYFESDVWISKGGSWIASLQQSTTNRYLQAIDWNGTKSPIVISNDTRIKTNLFFMDDSTLVYQTQSATDSKDVKFVIGQLSGNSFQSLAELTSKTSYVESFPKLIDLSGSYKLYSLASKVGTSDKQFLVRTSSTLAGLKDSVPEIVTENMNLYNKQNSYSGSFEASGNQLVFIKKNSGSSTMSPTGGNKTSDILLKIRSEIFSKSSTQNIQGPFSQKFYEAKELNVNQSGNLLLVLAGDYLSCEAKQSFGSLIHILDLSNNQNQRFLTLMDSQAKSYFAESSACSNKLPDGSDGNFDLQIDSAKINFSASNLNNFSVLYTSRSNNDLEVYHANRTNGVTTITNISNNKP